MMMMMMVVVVVNVVCTDIADDGDCSRVPSSQVRLSVVCTYEAIDDMDACSCWY